MICQAMAPISSERDKEKIREKRLSQIARSSAASLNHRSETDTGQVTCRSSVSILVQSRDMPTMRVEPSPRGRPTLLPLPTLKAVGDGRTGSINIMNRLTAIDSKQSLDVAGLRIHTPRMLYQPYSVLLHRRDPTRDMDRFYGLSVEPSLFGGIVLVRRWGRAGRSERHKVEHFASETDAIAAFLAHLARKRRRGYRPEPIVSFNLKDRRLSNHANLTKVAEPCATPPAL